MLGENPLKPQEQKGVTMTSNEDKKIKRQAQKKMYDEAHIRKTIRFTKDEYTQIESQLSQHNLTFVEFAKAAILKKKIKTKLNNQLLYEVNHIGNNLNQIAKKANQGDRKNLLIQLIEIEKYIKELTKQCM